MDTDVDALIREHALKNAVLHHGTADPKAVVGKIHRSRPPGSRRGGHPRVAESRET
jgi:hypothetical protein